MKKFKFYYWAVVLSGLASPAFAQFYGGGGVSGLQPVFKIVAICIDAYAVFNLLGVTWDLYGHSKALSESDQHAPKKIRNSIFGALIIVFGAFIISWIVFTSKQNGMNTMQDIVPNITNQNSN